MTKTSLSADALGPVFARLSEANARFAARYPGQHAYRQPVHTVYGGAHLFKADAARKLGDVAARALDLYAPDFAAFARETGRTVRFIEFMPLDAGEAWERSRVVPGEEILARIHSVWPLEPASDRGIDAAPADRYRFVDGRGEIGMITSVTRAFCGSCNRLRLTADGAIRNCLFANNEASVRDLLRSGADDADVARLIRETVWAKRAGHGINDPAFLRPARSMSMIGG